MANTFQNLGSLIAGIIAGTIIDKMGWNAVFIYAAAMAAMSAVSILLVKKLRR